MQYCAGKPGDTCKPLVRQDTMETVVKNHELKAYSFKYISKWLKPEISTRNMYMCIHVLTVCVGLDRRIGSSMVVLGLGWVSQ